MTALSLEDKLKEGQAKKEQGNTEFKSGNYSKGIRYPFANWSKQLVINEALRLYHESILYLKGLDNSSLSAFVPSSGNIADAHKTTIQEVNLAVRGC